jgi:hypothetical protein
MGLPVRQLSVLIGIAAMLLVAGCSRGPSLEATVDGDLARLE